MSPCLPARVLAAMQRRYYLGDQDAATWLKVHARAYAGDPDAQRVFARVCESGLYRATADLQRAFFWYYRAWLQGDVQAAHDAERLMRSTRISSTAMAEPMLIFPGQWRITANLSDRLNSTSLFELSEDGTASGCLIGDSGAAAAIMNDTRAAVGDPYGQPACALSKHEARYRGGWAYDDIGHVLTVIFDLSESGARRWRRDYWQIELLGCRAGALYGRDRRSVGYTLECITA
jgi:TPR repeat protein